MTERESILAEQRRLRREMADNLGVWTFKQREAARVRMVELQRAYERARRLEKKA